MTDPANYTLVGQATGAATIQAVRYDPTTRTALLIVSGLIADQYTLTVGDSIVRAPTASALLVPYVTQFTAVSDLSQYVKLTFTTHAVRPEHRHGLVRRHDREHQPVQPAGADLPDPRPGAGLHRHARRTRTQSSNGSWLISLNSTVPGGVAAGAGAEHDRPDADDQRPRRPGDRLHDRRSRARPPRPAPRSSTASR